MRIQVTVLASLLVLLAGPRSSAQNFVDIKPTPQQLAWQDLEIGVMICFGPNTFTDKEWGDGTVDPKVFNPVQCDPAQWGRAAKAAGAKYLILVAKHHDGFCLWPSKHTQYSVQSSPWKNGQGDLVKEVAEACRKLNLKFGIYLSPWDRHAPDYKSNAAYDNYYSAQVEELVTRYGPLVEWWLDGAGSEGHVYDFDRYIRILRTYQPNTLIFADVDFLKYGDIRWVGNEDGTAEEDNWNVIDRLGYLRWRPGECDTPLRKKHWFWHPNDEANLKSLAELLQIYHESVGRGAQLVLGLAPDDRGLLPEVDVARLWEFGEAVRRIYGNNLALKGTHRSDCGENVVRAFDGDPDTFWIAPPNTHRAVLAVNFARPISFDRTIVMEWLNLGQHIQKYKIEAWDGGEWKVLHVGSTIGHKKIDIFPRTSTTSIRLSIVTASGSPAIREFGIYDGAGK